MSFLKKLTIFNCQLLNCCHWRSNLMWKDFSKNFPIVGNLDNFENDSFRKWWFFCPCVNIKVIDSEPVYTEAAKFQTWHFCSGGLLREAVIFRNSRNRDFVSLCQRAWNKQKWFEFQNILGQNKKTHLIRLKVVFDFNIFFVAFFQPFFPFQ